MTKKPLPLAVDLDGTLIKTDVLHEALILFMQCYPWKLFHLIIWWSRGRAYLKQQLAKHVSLAAAYLPYHPTFLAFLKEEKKKGREIILATAADKRFAQAVCEHLKLFDDYIASEGTVNLRSAAKGERLNQRYGRGRYAYAGNSRHDLPIWKEAGEIIAVNTPKRVLQCAENLKKPLHIFESSRILPGMIEALRPWQWVKNVLILLPLIAGHKILELPKLISALAAVLLFCFAASAIYIVNDLLDLVADRQHPTKRMRPFARGAVPIPQGLYVACGLLVISIFASFYISTAFFKVIVFYLSLTTAYSAYLKKLVLVDVLVLAGLYITRVYAGYTACELPLSHWLLGCALFLFLSLAFMKRYTELRDVPLESQAKAIRIPGCGYQSDDLEQVAIFGTVSGYIAALIIVFYVNSGDVLKLYTYPQWLWLLCPLFLYSISSLWLLARRGEMHQDPVLFASTQGNIYCVLALIGLLMLLAV